MKIFQRLGVIPYLLLGVGLAFIGLSAWFYIANSFFPFNPEQRLDLVRSVGLDRVDSATILEAASAELIIAFLGSVFLFVTGIALPIAYFLNKRFGKYADERFGESSSTPLLVVLRQAIGGGFWVSFCVWLQMNRAFGFAAALLVAFVLILFELLLQIRTRATSVPSNP